MTEEIPTDKLIDPTKKPDEQVELPCGCQVENKARCIVCKTEPIRGSKKIHGRFIHVCSDVCAMTAYLVIDRNAAKT